MTVGSVPSPLARRRFGDTTRPDRWWLRPLGVFAVLGGFVVYATWAAFQGDHYRFFPYLAPGLLVILASDVWRALWFTDAATGRTVFGLGVGTLVLATNVVLLGGYTLGCHSLRHLVGGGLDILAGRPVRRAAYAC